MAQIVQQSVHVLRFLSITSSYTHTEYKTTKPTMGNKLRKRADSESNKRATTRKPLNCPTRLPLAQHYRKPQPQERQTLSSLLLSTSSESEACRSAKEPETVNLKALQKPNRESLNYTMRPTLQTPSLYRT